MFAVIEDRNKQYRVQEGDFVVLDRNDQVEVGAQIEFDRVLFLGGDSAKGAVGAPYVSGARVTATVLDHPRGKKIVVGKFRRRKGYRRKNGHRAAQTRVRIDGIHG